MASTTKTIPALIVREDVDNIGPAYFTPAGARARGGSNGRTLQKSPSVHINPRDQIVLAILIP